MMVQEKAGAVRQTVQEVRGSLLQAIDSQTPIPSPGQQNQVHLMIDLLRASCADAETLRRGETISCILHTLPRYRREGRVNAHDSAMLRLRRAADAL
jgi:hypothetical protein